MYRQCVNREPRRSMKTHLPNELCHATAIVWEFFTGGASPRFGSSFLLVASYLHTYNFSCLLFTVPTSLSLFNIVDDDNDDGGYLQCPKQTLAIYILCLSFRNKKENLIALFL